MALPDIQMLSTGVNMVEVEPREAKALDPLWVQRVILCDLLIGRWMRGNAQKILNRGLELEKIGKIERYGDAWEQHIDEELTSAAHMERMAVMSEQGLVLWGGRLTRRGESPEDDYR